MKKIQKTMTFQEIFSSFPEKREELAFELMSSGLGCVGCMQAGFETLEEGLYSHGFDDSAIEKIIQKLNSIVDQK
ncbi:MAG: disulfide oxidoreductase [Chlamydiae bacterium]|nr:disulfide oxidoreductase [Chlamydiota bacterium]